MTKPVYSEVHITDRNPPFFAKILDDLYDVPKFWYGPDIEPHVDEVYLAVQGWRALVDGHPIASEGRMEGCCVTAPRDESFEIEDILEAVGAPGRATEIELYITGWTGLYKGEETKG